MRSSEAPTPGPDLCMAGTVPLPSAVPSEIFWYRSKLRTSLCKGEVGRLRCAKPTGWGSRIAEIAAYDPTQHPRLGAGVADVPFQDSYGACCTA